MEVSLYHEKSWSGGEALCAPALQAGCGPLVCSDVFHLLWNVLRAIGSKYSETET